MFATNRQDFTNRCLRELGYPVIEINVDDDQVADRVDDALNKYWEFHFDGVEKLYMKHQLSADDVANSYVTVPDTIRGVTKIFPYTGGSSMTGDGYMFDLRYQLRLHDLYDFTSTSYVSYELTMMHLEHLQMLFSGIPGIRFNKINNKVFIDRDTINEMKPGAYIIIECYRILDPDVATALWSDPWIFKYATCMIKKQWGNNLKKFGNVPLPGGLVLDGQKLYDEAVAEQTALEFELRDTYEEPPQMIVG